MKKTICGVAGCLMATVLLLTSCLESEETVLSSAVSLYSFSIDDINTNVTYKTSGGEDTTITKTITGDNYLFAIDQLKGLVYNTDSLPLGTDITGVVVSVSTDGYVTYNLNGVETSFVSTDSIDFTNPVVFTITSTDGLYSRKYKVSVNVAQENADSLVWHGMLDNNFPGRNLGKQKAVCFDGKIMVFGVTNSTGEVKMSYTYVDDGLSWTSLQSLTGVSGDVDGSSVTQFDNKLYLLAGGRLYASSDGMNWTAVEGIDYLDYLLVATGSESVNPCMWAVGGDTLYSTSNGSDFVEQGAVPANFPETFAAGLSYPLSTNSSIDRFVVVGFSSVYSNEALVWSRLSTENVWSWYMPSADNAYACPKLNGLTVFRYDGKLFAMGAGGNSREELYEPFAGLFVSDDNGITWVLAEENTMLPDVFKGRTSEFSCVVDDNGYVWVMWSGSDASVFKGRKNGLTV